MGIQFVLVIHTNIIPTLLPDFMRQKEVRLAGRTFMYTFGERLLIPCYLIQFFALLISLRLDVFFFSIFQMVNKQGQTRVAQYYTYKVRRRFLLLLLLDPCINMLSIFALDPHHSTTCTLPSLHKKHNRWFLQDVTTRVTDESEIIRKCLARNEKQVCPRHCADITTTALKYSRHLP